MSKMEITPSMMKSIAQEIKDKMEEWDAAVAEICRLQAEMNLMWDGVANNAFNLRFQEDKAKFQRLSAMMAEYQNAIITSADKYVAADEEAKQIVNR